MSAAKAPVRINRCAHRRSNVPAFKRCGGRRGMIRYLNSYVFGKAGHLFSKFCDLCPEFGFLSSKFPDFLSESCNPPTVKLFSGRFHPLLRFALLDILSDARGLPLESVRSACKIVWNVYSVK